MNKVFIFTAGALLLLTTGCVISIDGDDDPDFSSNFSYSSSSSSFDSVYAADFSDNALTVTVSDNGCTTKEFFNIAVDHDGGNQFDLGLQRIREDFCKANNPDGVSIQWTYAELGLPDGAEVTLRNQVKR